MSSIPGNLAVERVSLSSQAPRSTRPPALCRHSAPGIGIGEPAPAGLPEGRRRQLMIITRVADAVAGMVRAEKSRHEPFGEPLLLT